MSRNNILNAVQHTVQKNTLQILFESPQKVVIFLTLIGFITLSGAIIFGAPIFTSILISFAVFLLYAEFFLPKTFLLIIVSARMGTDFLADQISIRIGESLLLPLSQILGILLIVYGLTFFFVKIKKERFLRVPMLSLFTVLFLWGAFSLFYSPLDNKFSLVLRECARLFGIFFLFAFSYYTIRSTTNLRRVFLVFFVSSILPILLGGYQFLYGIGYTDEAFSIPRIFGTFSHPNVFSLYLFCLLVLAFAYRRILAQSMVERYVTSGFIALYGIFLILTYTRIALFIALSFFVLLAFIQNKKLLAPLLLFPLIAFFLVPSIQERFSDILEFRSSSSLAWRISLWRDATQSVFTQERELIGYGMSSFSTIVEGIRGNKLGSTDPHSDPIRFFVEGGIIGIGIYLFMFITIIRKIRTAWKSAIRSPILKEIFPIIFAFFIALTIAGFTDHIHSNTVIQWIFWIILGAVFSLARENENAPPITERASVKNS